MAWECIRQPGSETWSWGFDDREPPGHVIHATVELLNAMRGISPVVGQTTPWRSQRQLKRACQASVIVIDSGSALSMLSGAAHDGSILPAFVDASSMQRSFENIISTSNCPECLLLMREAADPVRFDYLHERGLE